jgi:hypothetical protein
MLKTLINAIIMCRILYLHKMLKGAILFKFITYIFDVIILVL